MYELFLLVALVALVVWLLRGPGVVALDNPVIIQVDGSYHATIAPQLVQAAEFIGRIRDSLGQTDRSAATVTRCFEVRDGKLHYLLAASLRAGILYFQVISPVSRNNEENYKALSEFAAQVLLYHPLVSKADESCTESLCRAIDAAAGGLSCLKLEA